MRIEHIAMYVKDLEETKNFFIKYFNATSNEDTMKIHIQCLIDKIVE